MYAKKEKLWPPYISKNNSNREKQVISLITPNGKGWHYLEVKKLTALLRGITSKHYVDFYCQNRLHSFRTKNKLESDKKLYKNKGFCNVIMFPEDTKILEFYQSKKSDKAPFIIYADLECIIQKTDGCKNNLVRFIYNKSKRTYSIFHLEFIKIFK